MITRGVMSTVCGKLFVEANLNSCCFVLVHYIYIFFHTISVWKVTGLCDVTRCPVPFSFSILICFCGLFPIF